MREELQPLLSALEEYQEKIKNDGLGILRQSFMTFFEKYPLITELSWRQYTPYFNDGEACVFSVHTYSIEFKLDGEEERLNVDDYIYDDNFPAPLKTTVKSAYKELANALEAVEDVLQAVFGDHAEIIVNREEVRVESCDHE